MREMKEKEKEKEKGEEREHKIQNARAHVNQYPMMMKAKAKRQKFPQENSTLRCQTVLNPPKSTNAKRPQEGEKKKNIPTHHPATLPRLYNIHGRRNCIWTRPIPRVFLYDSLLVFEPNFDTTPFFPLNLLRHHP
jgi:hypothetical protein